MRAPFLCLAMISLCGCRTGQKQNYSTDLPVKVFIQMEGVSLATIEKYQLVAQLKRCADVQGEQKTGTAVYQFTAANLRKDMKCDLFLVGPSAEQAGVSFFSKDDDGIYFSAESISIKSDATGALISSAYMQKNFTTKLAEGLKTWRLEVPIQTGKALSDACICDIECLPALTNDAALVSSLNDSKTAGRCVFENTLDQSVADTSCKKLIAYCGSELWSGEWPTATAIAGSGKSFTMPALVLKPATTDDSGTVVVLPEIQRSPN